MSPYPDKVSTWRAYNSYHLKWGRTRFELKGHYPELYKAMEKFDLLGKVPDKNVYHTKKRQPKPFKPLSCYRCGRRFHHPDRLGIHLKEHEILDDGGKVNHNRTRKQALEKMLEGMK